MPIPKQRVAGNMYGREDAIRSLRCISQAAGGCEREISEAEYIQWDTATKAEYGQSGWCLDCQNRVFRDPDEAYCSCMSVDVGVGIMIYEDEYCEIHGDPISIRISTEEYDPDMREDEPPHDMHEIEWLVMA